MKANVWYGRRFSQRIEMKLRDTFGDEWMLDNPPCNFEILQRFAQENKFKCADYEYQIANVLRKLGLPMDHQVIYFNRYIADLSLGPARTIIELDGFYHEHLHQKLKDNNRDKVFIKFGFDVHRWKINVSPEHRESKILCFFKAYKRFAKNYHLKPFVRPHAVEKIFHNGTIQKALNLKKRVKRVVAR